MHNLRFLIIKTFELNLHKLITNITIQTYSTRKNFKYQFIVGHLLRYKLCRWGLSSGKFSCPPNYLYDILLYLAPIGQEMVRKVYRTFYAPLRGERRTKFLSQHFTIFLFILTATSNCMPKFQLGTSSGSGISDPYIHSALYRYRQIEATTPHLAEKLEITKVPISTTVYCSRKPKSNQIYTKQRKQIEYLYSDSTIIICAMSYSRSTETSFIIYNTVVNRHFSFLFWNSLLFPY